MLRWVSKSIIVGPDDLDHGTFCAQDENHLWGPQVMSNWKKCPSTFWHFMYFPPTLSFFFQCKCPKCPASFSSSSSLCFLLIHYHLSSPFSRRNSKRPKCISSSKISKLFFFGCFNMHLCWFLLFTILIALMGTKWILINWLPNAPISIWGNWFGVHPPLMWLADGPTVRRSFLEITGCLLQLFYWQYLWHCAEDLELAIWNITALVH